MTSPKHNYKKELADEIAHSDEIFKRWEKARDSNDQTMMDALQTQLKDSDEKITRLRLYAKIYK